MKIWRSNSGAHRARATTGAQEWVLTRTAADVRIRLFQVDHGSMTCSPSEVSSGKSGPYMISTRVAAWAGAWIWCRRQSPPQGRLYQAGPGRLGLP
jgi:hypothetical protein